MAVNYSDLLNPTLKAQFELGMEALQPLFEEQRGAIGSTLATRGIRRTSGTSYQNALSKQFSTEQTQAGSILSTMLGEQFTADEAETQRTWQSGENKLNRENAITLAKIAGEYNLAGIETSAEAAENAAEKDMLGKGFSGIASVATKLILGGL